jgi:serine/threonine protein kinase
VKTTAYEWDQLLRMVRAAVEPDYAVVRLLGAGGMASVYLAHRHSDGRAVALKVMYPSLMTDTAYVARFEREARTIARIEHPHVVRIHAVLRCDGLLCLEMPYLAGGSLAHIIADHPRGLPLPIALHWLAQIGSAVSCAHDAGVLHRDLNTCNVLFDADGNAFVTDFGIAIAAGEARLTELGLKLGTPAYMSPEQLADTAPTAASDQYAFGVVAYELVAGRRPFYGPTPSIVDAHLSQPPPPLTNWRPDCPAKVAQAIRRMLEKNPAARFANVMGAVVALGARQLPRADPHHERLRQLMPAAGPIG